MSTDGSDINSPVRDMSRVQMALVAQLFQAATTMHHIDEMFQWLAYAIVQGFNIQLMQFWTNQVNQTGRLVVQLRTVVRQDPTLPEQVVINDQITYIAQRITSGRRSYTPQPVETLFPSYQTTLLKRYGLNYCGACFTSGNVLLPPPENVFSNERSATLLTMTTLLFTQQSSHPDVIRAIGAFLDQAVAIAVSRGLLMQAANTPPPMSSFTPPPPVASSFTFQPPVASPFTPQPAVAPPFTSQPVPQDVVLPLEQLIPRRKQDADLLLSDNPFAGAAIISDKKARRLHAAIDGRTNIANLCSVTGMDIKEVRIALQVLLNQHRIDLYEPGGQPVKDSLLRNNM